MLFTDKGKGKKGQGGTPEKSGTPSQDADENQAPSRNVIWNEDIEKLQIKEEDLKNVSLSHCSACTLCTI